MPRGQGVFKWGTWAPKTEDEGRWETWPGMKTGGVGVVEDHPMYTAVSSPLLLKPHGEKGGQAARPSGSSSAL